MGTGTRPHLLCGSGSVVAVDFAAPDRVSRHQRLIILGKQKPPEQHRVTLTCHRLTGACQGRARNNGMNLIQLLLANPRLVLYCKALALVGDLTDIHAVMQDLVESLFGKPLAGLGNQSLGGIAAHHSRC